MRLARNRAAAAGKALILFQRNRRKVQKMAAGGFTRRAGGPGAEGVDIPDDTAQAGQEKSRNAIAGINAEGWWLDRRRAANFTRRLTRDLREKRKTPPVLLRRGAALYRAEPGLRREAMRQGFAPTSMRAALARLSG